MNPPTPPHSRQEGESVVVELEMRDRAPVRLGPQWGAQAPGEPIQVTALNANTAAGLAYSFGFAEPNASIAALAVREPRNATKSL